jgi:hypothetical protein
MTFKCTRKEHNKLGSPNAIQNLTQMKYITTQKYIKFKLKLEK